MQHIEMSNQAPYSEQDLQTALKKKDKQAFEYFYDNYSELVYGLVSRITTDEKMRVELLKEVFAKAWKEADGYNKLQGKLSTWIMNLARVIVTEKGHTGAFKSGQSAEDAEISVGSTGTPQTEADVPEIKKYRTVLREEQQQLLELIYFKGHTHEEAAKKLNIPLGTVKTRIRKSLLALRRYKDVGS